MKTKFLLTLCFIILHSALCLSARAQGSAFTYQGRLNNGGAPANGNFDLTFSLFSTPSGAGQVGTTLTNSPVTVGNGLFSVTLDFGAGAFPGADRWLEIGVRTSGPGTFTTLAPRQKITATPYAVTAGAVTGPINGGLISAGTVTGTQLAANAVTANLNAASQSAVASGGILISSNANSAELLNAGYIKLGQTELQLGELWQGLGFATAPSARYDYTAVWTGSEMVIWGGSFSDTYDAGERYNPVANSWTAVNTNGAPIARALHSAVWTGSEMIVWGGYYQSNYIPTSFSDGGRYNPTANSWTALNTNGAPAARDSHTAVWTGSEMIVWGGKTNSGPPNYIDTYLNDGGRYNPIANSWTALSTNGAPTGRTYHAAVWTGSEMIIWGGRSREAPNYNSTYFGDGGRYNPVANSWTAVNTNGAPTAREGNTAVWTGSEMIVWGGHDTTYYSDSNDGGRYNPVANSWTAVSTISAPSARQSHTAVWTGSEMIVWGGQQGGNRWNTGGRYNPTVNRWTAATTIGAPTGLTSHTAVWTGSKMIVWGGYDGYSSMNDTISYTPGHLLYLYQRP